ncbi:MAG: amidohydrolase/deacetylase family metallohydrolase [Anaerolineales bacterium]
MYDLILKGGTVIDPSQNIETVMDIAFTNNRITMLAKTIPETDADQVVNTDGIIITPGLIDIHVHIFEHVSYLGVNPEKYCLGKGVTTVVDAGSAGARNFSGLRKFIIDVSRTRILAYINLSELGMLSSNVGELEDLRFADKKAALRIIEDNRDLILGIKVRMDTYILGDNGLEVLKLARETSDASGLPIMFHIGETSPPLEKILAEARSGDVITHCYTGRPRGILDDDGVVLPEVDEAQKRGIIFDVGHGLGGFTFRVARQAIAQGVLPGTISTDLHSLNVSGPVFDLATTMSKFLHLGLNLRQVVEMTTLNPARVIRMENHLGTLKPGSIADLTLLKLHEGPISLSDAGWTEPVETVIADRYLFPIGVVREGKLVYFPEKSDP